MSTFSVVIATGDIERVAQSLTKMDSESLGNAAVRAVNTVAERTFTTAVTKMTAGINLSPEYVKSRMRVDLAQDPKKPEAEITALRQGIRGTTLSSYGARVLTQPVKWPNGSFTPGKMGVNPHKPGVFLPWKERKGDPKRGIPAGMKAAGFAVEVTRGTEKDFPHAFVIPVGGRLLTVRRRGAKIQTVYGPSVWQLFRATVSRIYTDVEKDLETTLAAEVDRELGKLL